MDSVDCGDSEREPQPEPERDSKRDPERGRPGILARAFYGVGRGDIVLGLVTFMLVVVSLMLYSATNTLQQATTALSAATIKLANETNDAERIRQRERHSPPIVNPTAITEPKWSIALSNTAPFPIAIKHRCMRLSGSAAMNDAALDDPSVYTYTIAPNHVSAISSADCNEIARKPTSASTIAVVYSYRSVIDDATATACTGRTTWQAIKGGGAHRTYVISEERMPCGLDLSNVADRTPQSFAPTSK